MRQDILPAAFSFLIRLIFYLKINRKTAVQQYLAYIMRLLYNNFLL
jgi:hypothetical protein